MHLLPHCSTYRFKYGRGAISRNTIPPLVSNRLVNSSLEEHRETDGVPTMIDVKVPSDPLSVSCGLTTGALIP